MAVCVSSLIFFSSCISNPPSFQCDADVDEYKEGMYMDIVLFYSGQIPWSDFMQVGFKDTFLIDSDLEITLLSNFVFLYLDYPDMYKNWCLLLRPFWLDSLIVTSSLHSSLLPRGHISQLERADSPSISHCAGNAILLFLCNYDKVCGSKNDSK